VGAFLLSAASFVLGAGSLLLLLVFLFDGPLQLVRLDWSPGAVLALDAALSLLFFLQHSTMTRAGFRRRLSRRVPEAFHGALYSVASGAALLPLVLLWQESPQLLAEADGPVRTLLRGLFLLALVGFVWGVGALGSFDAFGLRQVRRHVRRERPPETPFSVRGPYRWVRHPLYFFALVLFWTYPVWTADRLLFNVLWTGWVWLGTVLEERDLVRTFGEPYREYQRRVPMLLPLRWRPVAEPPG
jgi:protein-S-isoprenylcysteine O-methyltransferase Ste14